MSSPAAAPRPATPQQVLLISSDPKFLNGCEVALSLRWPKTVFLRAPASGAERYLKILPIPAHGVLIGVDHRQELKPELVRHITRLIEAGASVHELRELPRTSRDLIPRADIGTELIEHNLPWSEAVPVARAMARLWEGGSISDIEPSQEIISTLSDSRKKGEFIQQRVAELKMDSVQRTRREKIAAVFDELLMNVFYRANPAKTDDPVDPVTAEVRWTLGESAYTLVVSDPYGTFDHGKLTQLIVQFNAQDKAQITRTAGRGGGVGMYVVMRIAESIRVRVIPGALTEISVRINLNTTVAPVEEVGIKGFLIAFARDPKR
jgi:hypothetical protein